MDVPVLRVLTLNVWFRPPLDARRREMAAWLDRCAPHLVCLQEVRDDAGDGRTSAHRLAEEASGSWHVAFGGLPDGEGVVSGNAVLSRWPIDTSEVLPLPCGDARPKLVVHARTGGVDVFSFHLTSDPAGAGVREEQVLVLDRFVADRSAGDLPPVLAGDANAPPSAAAVAFLRGETSLRGRSTFFQDAWEVAGVGSGTTWTHANPHTPPAWLVDARIDYVLVGCPRVPLGWSGGGDPDVVPVGQVVGAALACHEPLTSVLASDHYGVVADVCWPVRLPA
jgi:endonuclease/exonuclease/phosphatase family metal-dependent hydrolase